MMEHLLERMTAMEAQLAASAAEAGELRQESERFKKDQKYKKGRIATGKWNRYEASE